MATLPSIDVVIIGLNSARTLEACIESVQASRYPNKNVAVIYVDGGSKDDSLAIARSLGCACIEVDNAAPAPGRQRNAGWTKGQARYVQFMDSDTILDPEWLTKAVAAFGDATIGAVCGEVHELHPEASVFNWIGDLEWNAPPGDVAMFGGNVLVSRDALERTEGFDPSLIGGEDPELAYRIRRCGFRIVRLAEPMVLHDLAMRSIRHYWRRAFRSGHAFAEVHDRHDDFWKTDVERIAARCLPFLVGIAALPFAALSPWAILGTLAGSAILLRPRLFLVGKFQENLSLDRRGARIYAWHASFVVVPQFFGMLRFYLGKLISRPLTNRRLVSVDVGKEAS